MPKKAVMGSIEHDFGSDYKSTTYVKRTCQDIYVIVAYRPDDPEKIDFIRLISSSRKNPCATSFMESMSDILTYAVRRIRNSYERDAIIKNLKHHSCLSCPANKDHVKSCSDAIGQVLDEILQRPEQEEGEKEETEKKGDTT